MKLKIAAGLLALTAFAGGAQATNLSFTGAFNYDNDVQQFTFTLFSKQNVTLRSWSYAGGVNAHGVTIARGGFDPIMTLYDAAGDRIDVQDDGDCPAVAADAVTGRCLDVEFKGELDPGTYFATLQQWDNFAAGPTLADGFRYDAEAFRYFRDGFVDAAGDRRNGNWAFDLLDVDTGSIGVVSVPEPASLALLGLGLLGMLGMWGRKRR